MDDLTKEFLLESGEGLDRMERRLAEMQKGSHTAESIAEVFRAVHTIKGTVGFLGFPRLERLAHAGEHLLALVRDGARALDQAVATGLLLLLDRLRVILTLIETTGTEGSRAVDEDAALIDDLMGLARNEPVQAEVRALADDEVAPLHEEMCAGTSDTAGPGHAGLSETTLRVSVETMNRLMNLVSDLVQMRNQALQKEATEDLRRFGQRLDGVTTDLRETVMHARMQPVEQLFAKFPRLVREVAQSCGKRVRLETSGGETGLDKSLLEALKDPLTHAVRNAIDHGIETPEERQLLGKPAVGVLQLRAFHESGHVVIEVADDGAGIWRDAVLRRAVERGLVAAERATKLTDAEAREFVFEPGFSTRDQATLISGRGVGMDVVRSNVERAGGTAELLSLERSGTTLRMRVPLTLAIVPALIVRCGGETFAVPRSAVLEMVTVDRNDEAAVVQRIGGARVYRLRGRLIPLIDLSEMLGLRSDTPNGYYIAVLEAKGRKFGLIVDDIANTQEIVVKPLSKALRRLQAYSGAALLADGSIGLILDPAGLARLEQMNETQDREGKAAVVAENTVATASIPMLLFSNECDERVAMPLGLVERIETLLRNKVERIGGKMVIEYGGDVLPLHDPGGLVGLAPEAHNSETCDSEAMLVVICTAADAGVRCALVVREVLDIADAELLDSFASGPKVVRMENRLTALHEMPEVDTNIAPSQWKEAA